MKSRELEVRSLASVGRGGFAELRRTLFGVAEGGGESVPVGPGGIGLDFRGVVVGGGGFESVFSVVPENRMVRLSEEGRSGLVLLRNPLWIPLTDGAPEPLPWVPDERNLRRLIQSGSFSLEGDAGSYKINFELDRGNCRGGVFRLVNEENRVLGWLGVGEKLERAVFPVVVCKDEVRPMMLKLERVDPGSGEVVDWACDEIRRAWGSYLGKDRRDTWSEVSLDGSGRTIIERRVKTGSGGILNVETRWDVSSPGRGEFVLKGEMEVVREGGVARPPVLTGLGGTSWVSRDASESSFEMTGIGLRLDVRVTGFEGDDGTLADGAGKLSERFESIPEKVTVCYRIAVDGEVG